MNKKTKDYENQAVAESVNAAQTAVGTKKGNRCGRKDVQSTSRFLGRGRGWTGFVNLKEFYEFMTLLGLSTVDVAGKIGQTRASIVHILKADDAPLSVLMNIASAFGYTLALEYAIPEKQKVFEPTGAVIIPKMALEEARGKRMFFLRKAMQATGNTASDLGKVVGFNRSSVLRWFAIDDFRMSYAKRIAEGMGWKLDICYRQMTVRERAAKKKAAKVASCPPVKDIFASAAPQTAAARKFLEKLRGALEERLCDEALSPEKLARAFRTETPFLHARIKGLLGIGTEEAIESYRLDRAAAILKEERCTCKEVAKRVGIANPPAFTKKFKKRYGVTPMDFTIQATIDSEAEDEAEE